MGRNRSLIFKEIRKARLARGSKKKIEDDSIEGQMLTLKHRIKNVEYDIENTLQDNPILKEKLKVMKEELKDLESKKEKN